MEGKQFDRSLLGKLLGVAQARIMVPVDRILLEEKDDEKLWDALACLDESGYEPLGWMQLDRKIRTVLQYRQAQEEKNQRELMNRRYWGPLIVGVLGVVVGILSVILSVLFGWLRLQASIGN